MYQIDFTSIQLWEICNVLVPYIIIAQFFGQRGPLVLPSVGPVPSVRQQEFLLLLLLLLFHPRHPPSPVIVAVIVVVVVVLVIVAVANDHLEDLASCKRSSKESRLLQLIIRRIRPPANDHPEDLTTCK